LQDVSSPLWIAALAAMTVLAACGQSSAPAANTTPDSNSGELDYRPPPELTGAAPAANGGFELSGVASPGVTVRLATPTGAPAFAAADANGDWRLVIPASADPRLFSLSMTEQGRVVQANGYLFVAPGGVAARLRAGGGSEQLGENSPGLAPRIVDYDSQRAATVSGIASPGETVSLRVDGIERGQAVTDARRRFVLPIQPLAAGDHDFELAGAEASVEFHAVLSPPAPLAASPFVATPVGGGWRIDWLTPGGGEQTTVILGPIGPSR
jgi:hypothetical protein